MTTETNDTIERYSVSGTGPYSFSYRIFDETDLVVTALESGEVDPVTLTLNTDYTVSNVNVSTGGSITLSSGAATTYDAYTLDIRSNTELAQPTSIKNQGTFLPSVHETAFDRLSRQVQDLDRQIKQAWRYPDNVNLDAVMTNRDSWLSKIPMVNASGVIEPAVATDYGTLTQSIIGGLLYPKTDAETAAGVTPDLDYIEPYKAPRYSTVEAMSGSDETGAINDAIASVANSGGGLVSFPFGKSINVLGTLLLPSTVKVDLNGCTLVGNGIGSGTMFDTAYLNGTTVTSNAASTDDTNRVIDARVFNGKIKNCNKAFNLKNFNENSLIDLIEFDNCTYNVYAYRPFYSTFKRLTSRGSASSAANAAFYWSTFVNQVKLESIYTIGRALAHDFLGGCYGLTINNCSAETCTDGFHFDGTIHSMRVFGNYFETITGDAFLFKSGSSAFVGIDIDNNWFNIVERCITASNFTGRWGRGNRRNSGNCTVDFSASSNAAVVEVPRNYTATNITAPGLPSNVSVGNRCIVSADDTLYNSGSGSPTVRSNNWGGSKTPINHWGDTGDPDSGVIPFHTHASSGGTSFNVVISTKHTTRTHSVLLYALRIADNSGTSVLYGLIYGTTVKQLDSVGKTITAADSSGVLQITIGTFSHPSGTYTATGKIVALA